MIEGKQVETRIETARDANGAMESLCHALYAQCAELRVERDAMRELLQDYKNNSNVQALREWHKRLNAILVKCEDSTPPESDGPFRVHELLNETFCVIGPEGRVPNADGVCEEKAHLIAAAMNKELREQNQQAIALTWPDGVPVEVGQVVDNGNGRSKIIRINPYKLNTPHVEHTSPGKWDYIDDLTRIDEPEPTNSVHDQVAPCPFCHSENTALHGNKYMSWAACNDCEATGPRPEDEEDSLDNVGMWNQLSRGTIPANEPGLPSSGGSPIEPVLLYQHGPLKGKPVVVGDVIQNRGNRQLVGLVTEVGQDQFSWDDGKELRYKLGMDICHYSGLARAEDDDE